jgi:hypothetical protein
MKGAPKSRSGKLANFGTQEGVRKFISCTRKVGHASERIALIKGIERSEAGGEGVKLYAYHCKECKQWHLTRRKPKRKPS